MANGVRTTNIETRVALSDDLIVNTAAGTAVQSTNDLSKQMAQSDVFSKSVEISRYTFHNFADMSAKISSPVVDGTRIIAGDALYDVDSTANPYFELNSVKLVPQKFRGEVSCASLGGDIDLAVQFGPVFLDGAFDLVGVLELPSYSCIRGVSRAASKINLQTTSSMVSIGGYSSIMEGANVDLAAFTIDGNDIADYGLVFSNLLRSEPTNMVASVWTGGGVIRDMTVEGCRKVGFIVGDDSDNLQCNGVKSVRHRDAGTQADALHVESPSHFIQCHFGNVTGYGVRSDYDVAGEIHGYDPADLSVEHQYTISNSRIDFCKKGLVYHNGFSPVAGPEAAVLTLDKCYLENGGYAGTSSPYTDKEPVTEATKEPSLIHCAAGSVSITDPQKLQNGWTRSCFKATNGKIYIRLGGVPIMGSASGGSRALDLFVAGLTIGDTPQIIIDGECRLEDPTTFTNSGYVLPRLGEYPINVLSPKVIWQSALDDPADWTAVGAVGGAAFVDATDPLIGQSALYITGNGVGSNTYVESTISPRSAGSRLIMAQIAVKFTETGAVNDGKFRVSLTGAGISLPTQTQNWPAAVAYGEWVYASCLAYVDDPTEDVSLKIFAANGTPSSDKMTIGSAKIVVL